MASFRRRIQALQAGVAGSVLHGTAQYAIIHQAFEVIILAGRVRRISRRRLLQVLHSTRALDTSLQQFTTRHQVPPHGNPSLGGYLRGLDRHHRPAVRLLYQKPFVHPPSPPFFTIAAPWTLRHRICPFFSLRALGAVRLALSASRIQP